MWRHSLTSGWLPTGQRRQSQAVNAYRTALEIQPHNVDALNNLGLAYQELGQFEKAIAAYEEALRLRPDLPEVEANLATAHELQRGTYSLAAYRHYRTGMQLKRAGNAEAAVAAWKQAIARKSRLSTRAPPVGGNLF